MRKVQWVLANKLSAMALKIPHSEYCLALHLVGQRSSKKPHRMLQILHHCSELCPCSHDFREVYPFGKVTCCSSLLSFWNSALNI